MLTKQVQFWQGEFGNEYTERNDISRNIVARKKLIDAVLEKSSHVGDILEVGANIGLNLCALYQRNLTTSVYYGLEPNDLAAHSKAIPYYRVNGTAENIEAEDNGFDFVFTSGVLIHIHPDNLKQAISEIYRVSSKYIACIEYFSDEPIEKAYRGHNGVLFKRDFGSLYMDTFPDLKLVDYGFAWKRATGLDNLTWWLFEKPSNSKT